MSIEKYIKNPKKLNNLSYVELSDIYKEANELLKQKAKLGVDDTQLSKFIDSVERLID